MWRAATQALATLAAAAAATAGGQGAAAQTPQAGPDPASAPARPGATSAAQPAPAAGSPAVSEVTVTAATPDYRSAIDRRSYAIGKDLQAGTGSLADVLRNVPSVSVDLEGGLTLRGDPSVTILVDGHPSALFSGPQRASALQQLPADQYERVEVMTNPSAAYNPDGTGGVINLVSKRSVGAGRTGSVRLNIGTKGRANGGVSAGYSAKKLSVSGGASFRHDASGLDGRTDRQVVDPVTARLTPQRAQSASRSDNTSGSVRAGLDYDLDARTRLSASVNGFTSRFSQDGGSTFRSTAASGPLAQDYDATTRFGGSFSGAGGSATWLRRFSGEQHDLSVRLSHDEVSGEFGGVQQFSYLRPAGATLFLDTRTYNDTATIGLKVDYRRPLPGGAKLVAGYELQVDDARFERRGRLGATEATAAALRALNNLFDIIQSVHAVYATWEKPLGDLTVQPGLRLEEVVIDSDQKTSGVVDHWSYFSAYPTLHVGYRLDDTRSLTANFGRRVQRPALQSLNPYLVYNGPLSYSQGDARLRPSVTESYELGYEYRRGQSYDQATLFFRDAHDSAVNVTRDLGGGVLLNTQANLGASRTLGLELTANGRLGKTLGYNASTTLFYNAIDAANLGFTAGRSDVSAQGRLSLNWEPTKADLVQLNLNVTGERLTPQGYAEANTLLTFGAQHRFTDKLTGVFTATDPFDLARTATVIDTPQLKQRSVFRQHPQAFYLGLTYAFGGAARRRPESFDFGGAPAPAPTP